MLTIASDGAIGVVGPGHGWNIQQDEKAPPESEGLVEYSTGWKRPARYPGRCPFLILGIASGHIMGYQQAQRRRESARLCEQNASLMMLWTNGSRETAST